MDTELYGMQRDCAEGSLLQQLDALHYGPPAETSPKVSSLGRCDSRCAYSSGFRKERLLVLIQSHYKDPDMAKATVESIWTVAWGVLSATIILIVNDLFKGDQK